MSFQNICFHSKFALFPNDFLHLGLECELLVTKALVFCEIFKNFQIGTGNMKKSDVLPNITGNNFKRILRSTPSDMLMKVWFTEK